ncbi:MAG: 50S ribosomal protein L9 [Coriobacteriia bacterium]|nr:50S ribosomal protein L9 [Coriobacteriia bacterium]
MKVILQGELTGKGGEGDVIEVAQGFAENYLFPQGIAIPATKGNLKQLEQKRSNIAKRELARTTDAETLREAMDGKQVVVRANVGEEGQLFGSVTTNQIADAILEQLGVTIDKKKINTPGVIKTSGKHKIQVNVYREIKAELTLSVIGLEQKEEELEPEEAAELPAEEVAEDEQAQEQAEA